MKLNRKGIWEAARSIGKDALNVQRVIKRIPDTVAARDHLINLRRRIDSQIAFMDEFIEKLDTEDPDS